MTQMKDIADRLRAQTEWHVDDAREAADEIERLREALAGLVGLTELLLGRDDLPTQVREALQGNHRIVEARAALPSRAAD